MTMSKARSLPSLFLVGSCLSLALLNLATFFGYGTTTNLLDCISSNIAQSDMNDEELVSILAGSDSKSSRDQERMVHMVVAADDNFAKKYQRSFEKMEQYAQRHGYTWTILNQDRFEGGILPRACANHKDFFFLKHCMVASWMEAQAFDPASSIFVFDADTIPFRPELPLDKWTLPFKEDVLLYLRGWNVKENGVEYKHEVMAGNYMVKNTVEGRGFLRAWAEYEFQTPPGFSSADNGALHIHLLRQVGIESIEWNQPKPCGDLYKNLRKPVTDWGEYWEYVTCTRDKLLPDNRYNKGPFSFRIMDKKTFAVTDKNVDSLEANDDSGPIFHHGVKFNDKGRLDPIELETKYNLSAFVEEK